MATAPKTTIGTMDCLCCGHEIPVKQAENGTISAPCAWCDFPAWAKKGTESHRIISSKLKTRTEPSPEPKKPAPAAPTPTPAPAAKKPATWLGV